MLLSGWAVAFQYFIVVSSRIAFDSRKYMHVTQKKRSQSWWCNTDYYIGFTFTKINTNNRTSWNFRLVVEYRIINGRVAIKYFTIDTLTNFSIPKRCFELYYSSNIALCNFSNSNSASSRYQFIVLGTQISLIKILLVSLNREKF